MTSQDNSMLKIDDLHVTRRRQEDPQGLNLERRPPAKCTPSWARTARARARSRNVLAGRPGYEVTAGSVTFEGRDLLALAPEERARAGLFLGFQYPVEIPGRQQRLPAARRR